MLHHPCILGGPQQREQNQNSKPTPGVTMMHHATKRGFKDCPKCAPLAHPLKGHRWGTGPKRCPARARPMCPHPRVISARSVAWYDPSAPRGHTQAKGAQLYCHTSVQMQYCMGSNGSAWLVTNGCWLVNNDGWGVN